MNLINNKMDPNLKIKTILEFIFIAMVCVLILFFISLVTGCSGKKGYIKYKENNKEQFAKDCAINFPIKEIYKEGKKDTIQGKTIYVYIDSVKCPDGTKKEVPLQTVKCPPTYINYPDTIIKIDSSVLYLYKNQVLINNNLEEEIKDLKKDKKNLTIYLILSGLISVLMGFIAFKPLFRLN